jgi:hypothetical protein
MSKQNRPNLPSYFRREIHQLLPQEILFAVSGLLQSSQTVSLLAFPLHHQHLPRINILFFGGRAGHYHGLMSGSAILKHLLHRP